MSVEPSSESDWVEGRPAHPVLALAADLASSVHARGLRLLVAALEHLLRQQSWARDRLRMHAGSIIRVGVGMKTSPALPPPELWLAVTPDGFFELADPGSVPRASLVLQPSSDVFTDFSRSGVEGLARHLRVDGDVMLAATLGELARHLRWDAEEDLSRVVGDVLAHRAFDFFRTGVDQLRGLVASGLAAQGPRPAGFGSDGSAGQAPGMSGPITGAALHGLRELFGSLDHQLAALERRADRVAAAARGAGAAPA